MRLSVLRSTVVLSVLAALAAAAPAFPQSAEPKVHRAQRDPEQRQALRRMKDPGRRANLGRLSPDERRPVTRKPGLTPVGVSREVPAAALQQAEWSVSPEGKRVWRLQLQSPEAANLRVRFKDFHVGAGQLWLLGANGSQAGPYTGDGLFHDGEFWTDLVDGDTVTIAYEPAEGADAIPFTIAEVSHRLQARAADEAPKAAVSASCTLDVACYSEYSDPASAVAYMIFESDGKSYQCSGALVSSPIEPAQPFFMTANHCISTEAEARSLLAFFNYQKPSCNGESPTLGRLPRVTGSALLAGGGMSLGDYTLLRLTNFPNVDVKLLGWISSDIAANQQVTSISHPKGDSKRIAMGQRTRDVTIRFSDGERMPANRGYQVSWLQGVTQGGSSGSPLLVNRDGKEYLVGTLSAGPDIDDDDDALVCKTENLTASYGRFSSAFDAVGPHLTGSAVATTPVPPQGTLSATPVINRSTTLTWQAAGVREVQIRIGSPTGPALTGLEGVVGSATASDWVTPGTIFYLQDATGGNSLGSGRTLAAVVAQGTQRAGVLNASPVSNAATTLTWQASGVTQVQIRINAPDGPAMTGLEPPRGSAATGNWAVPGMVFYLQDATDGDSAGAAKTLSTVRAR